MASPGDDAAAAAAAASGSSSLLEVGDKENNMYEDRDDISDVSAVMPKDRTVLTKSKKKTGGFNLRKSIAWNPAFFTEEGVLDNMELSVLSGSHVKVNGRPSSGIGSKISPLSRFGKSSNRSVLKEVVESSNGKLLAKFRSTENKGRKLFSTTQPLERDERKEPVGTKNTKSTRSIPKSIPRSPAAYPQKKASNSSSTTLIPKIPKFTPKKSQPSAPTFVGSTSLVRHTSKPNKKMVPVKGDHTPRLEGCPSKSKMEHSLSTKSSGPDVQNDVVPPATAIYEENSTSGHCRAFSPYSKDTPSSSVGAPAPTFAKPSALRMPSPSVGFFAKGKAPVSHGYTTQRNVEKCFTGNPSSITKPPRYKRPEDLKGRLCLSEQQPTDLSAVAKPDVQSGPTRNTPTTLAILFPSVKHSDPYSPNESMSKEIIRDSGRFGSTDGQEPLEDCLSAGSRANTKPLSLEKIDAAKHGVPNEHEDASQVEGRNIIKDNGHVEDSYSLEVICSSTKPIVGSESSSSCISSQVCILNDLHQSKSDEGFTSGINLESSLVRETTVANSLSESNSCSPDPDFMLDFGSCDHQNSVSSSPVKSAQSVMCADQASLGAVLSDLKPALVDSNAELRDSLAEVVQTTLLEESNTEVRMELDMNNSSVVKEAFLLHLGDNHNHRNRECSAPVEVAPPMIVMDQEAGTAVLSDLIPAIVDIEAELHDSLAEEIQPVLSEEPNGEGKMEFDTNNLSVREGGASHIEKDNTMDKPIADTVLQDRLKHLVPFTEEWLSVMEACGEKILEVKTGAVQNSPTEKSAPEHSPWSPVKRKAQDVGPFDCTKYSKSIRTSDDS